jgi:peptide-methionine (S)-S-oxide reductase
MGSAASTTKMAATRPVNGTTEDPTVAFVRNTVADNPVVIFSKTYCPYCVKAKTAISKAGAKVVDFQGAHVVELNTRSDGLEIQDALARMTGRRTVPNVFIGGKPVGGGDETEQLLREGVLPQMLRAAPQQLAADSASSPQNGEEAQKPVRAVHSITAVSAPSTQSKAAGGQGSVITLGAGCFWGVELAFQRLQGVYKTEVGYSNGSPTPVTYQAVCGGRTGHAEVVRVWYKPEEVSLKDILALWEARHDPTSKDKQGNDRGTQYRSAIFFHNNEQKDTALAWKAEAGSRLKRDIVTDIAPEAGYCAAEGYHQRYLEKGGQSAAKNANSGIRCYG